MSPAGRDDMTPTQVFRWAMDFTLEFEGGWSMDPDDRGGLTRFGISIVHNPDVDLETLTMDRAIQLAWERYWIPAHCGEFPPHYAVAVFDLAYNSGPARAVRMLQSSLEVAVDGRVGPITRGAAARRPDRLTYYLADRLTFLDDIINRDGSQMRFRRGWYRRVAALGMHIAAGPPEYIVHRETEEP